MEIPGTGQSTYGQHWPATVTRLQAGGRCAYVGHLQKKEQTFFLITSTQVSMNKHFCVCRRKYFVPPASDYGSQI